jgi:hypothetical protein
MDVVCCLKHCQQLLQYARQAKTAASSKKKPKGAAVGGGAGLLPAGLVGEAVALGRQYLALLLAQFGPQDSDILGLRDSFLAVPSCSNPTCCEVSSAVAETAAPVLKACSKCNAAAYCCRECQVAHFKNGHKELCKAAVNK